MNRLPWDTGRAQQEFIFALLTFFFFFWAFWIFLGVCAHPWHRVCEQGISLPFGKLLLPKLSGFWLLHGHLLDFAVHHAQRVLDSKGKFDEVRSKEVRSCGIPHGVRRAVLMQKQQKASRSKHFAVQADKFHPRHPSLSKTPERKELCPYYCTEVWLHLCQLLFGWLPSALAGAHWGWCSLLVGRAQNAAFIPSWFVFLSQNATFLSWIPNKEEKKARRAFK